MDEQTRIALSEIKEDFVRAIISATAVTTAELKVVSTEIASVGRDVKRINGHVDEYGKMLHAHDKTLLSFSHQLKAQSDLQLRHNDFVVSKLQEHELEYHAVQAAVARESERKRKVPLPAAWDRMPQSKKDTVKITVIIQAFAGLMLAGIEHADKLGSLFKAVIGD